MWWRYGALALTVALALAAGRRAPVRSAALLGRRPVLGGAALLCSACFALCGLGRLALTGLSGGVFMLLRAGLELLCAAWMGALAAAWLHRGHWHAPAGGLVLAVFGSAVFYMQVLGRFMENSSSWHRVAPTAQVWQMLAVLVLTSTLIRSVYLPGTSDGWSLCAAALAAYCLGLCWQLPELGSLLTGTGDLLDLLGAAELCCTGLLGGLCAAALAAYCLGLCWQLPELGSLLTGTGDLLDLLGAAELCCTGLLGGAVALTGLRRRS